MRPVHVVLAIAAFAAGCGGSDAGTSPNTNTLFDVYTLGDSFNPVYQTVTAGATVRWNFAGGSDAMGHNVIFSPVAGAPSNIDILKTGTASRVFTTKGTFHYDCLVHPGMFGEITVQ